MVALDDLIRDHQGCYYYCYYYCTLMGHESCMWTKFHENPSVIVMKGFYLLWKMSTSWWHWRIITVLWNRLLGPTNVCTNFMDCSENWCVVWVLFGYFTLAQSDKLNDWWILPVIEPEIKNHQLPSQLWAFSRVLVVVLSPLFSFTDKRNLKWPLSSAEVMHFAPRWWFSPWLHFILSTQLSFISQGGLDLWKWDLSFLLPVFI